MMEHPEEIQRQASDACDTRLWTNTVAVVNNIRTVGREPLTNRPADQEDVGTGCAGHWGGHFFVLTAEHVLKPDARPCDLRIFWRPTGGMERIGRSDLQREDIGDAVAIRDSNAAIHMCEWEDMAIVTMDSAEAAGTYTEFFDIAAEWIDPPDGEIVHCCGFPIDRNVPIGRRMVGTKEECDLALYPTRFSGKVFSSPNFLTNDYDPARHYLVPYQHNDSKHPEGVSGAAAWWESDKPQQIWNPNFKFAGICTSAYKNGTVERVVKASAVRRFLEEVLGHP